jgi:hypothetical protein
MTRRTGTLLELGLADDADPRQFLPWFFPPALPGSSLEFVLHTKSATRFAADDRGNVRIDGFKADELKLRMMYVATVVASNIDVGALDVSFDGGATGSMALAGRAKSESVFRSDATATLDESKLVVGP